MAERGPRGPYAGTARRRAAILEAAKASFAEHGFEASSMRDIAARAGLTHPGLLHHFASKEVLLAALLAQRDEEEARRSAASAPSSDQGPAAAAVFLHEMLLAHQRTPELMRLWAELGIAASRPDHPAHDYFVDRYQAVREALTHHFESGSFGGPLRGVDARTGAILFAALLDGLQTQWLLDTSLDISEPLACFLELIISAPTSGQVSPEPDGHPGTELLP